MFKIPSITVVIRSLIEKNNKFYLEISLNHCMKLVQRTYKNVRNDRIDLSEGIDTNKNIATRIDLSEGIDTNKNIATIALKILR